MSTFKKLCFAWVLLFIHSNLGLAEEAAPSAIGVPEAPPPTEQDLQFDQGRIFESLTGSPCQFDAIRIGAPKVYVLGTPAGPNEVALLKDPETGNAWAEIEPHHQCWKTHVYLFKTDMTAEGWNDLEFSSLDQEFKDRIAERINGSIYEKPIQVLPTWARKPSLSPDRLELSWAVKVHLMDMSSIMGSAPSIFHGLAHPTQNARPWSEVALTRLDPRGHGALFFTQLALPAYDETLRRVADDIISWSQQFRVPSEAFAGLKVISAFRPRDLVMGPAIKRSAQDQQFSQQISNRLQSFEDEKSKNFSKALLRLAPLLLAALLPLLRNKQPKNKSAS